MSKPATTRALTVTVPERQFRQLKSAVDSGAYASDSEVVGDALSLWEKREQLRAAELAMLKSAYAEGIASGAGREIDPAELLASLKAATISRG